VAEEGWRGVSDAGESGAAGADVAGIGGAVGSAIGIVIPRGFLGGQSVSCSDEENKDIFEYAVLLSLSCREMISPRMQQAYF
jgi:hypothetical protein